MSLHVQAVAQAQLLKHIFIEFTLQIASGLIPELRDSFIDYVLINLIIFLICLLVDRYQAYR